MSDEIVYVQARQDIAVLKIQNINIQAGFDRLDRTLNHIFIAILVAFAGAGGAEIWNLVFAAHGK